MINSNPNMKLEDQIYNQNCINKIRIAYKIREENRKHEKIICECGTEMLKESQAKHLRTNIHKNKLLQLSET